jgi:hypothetical protein
LQEVRSQNLLAGQTLESVRNYLLLAHRLDIIADDLETCRDQTLALALQRYWDDYGLLSATNVFGFLKSGRANSSERGTKNSFRRSDETGR